MATTGQQALNITLAVLDELGSTEYNTRAIYLINTLCDELYTLSDTYTLGDYDERPISGHITALTDALPLDDGLCTTVLPYAIGSRLMMIDQPDVAANFESIYQENLAKARRGIPHDIGEVTEYYEYEGEDFAPTT